MKAIATLATALAVALTTFPVAAQDRDDVRSREEARPRDLQRLQDDLANLDEQLRGLDTGDRDADSYRERADQIREDVIYLKVKMRRHQSQEGEGTGVDYAEVADLRAAIADLREDMERAFSGSRRELSLDQGTEFYVRLEEPLSSATARPEDRFEASVPRPVSAGRGTAIPAGTRVRGIVTDAEPAHRPSKGGRLELAFDAVYLGRERLDLRARAIAVDADQDGPGTVGKAGLGAILGGVLGGVVAGKNGAIVGTILGGSGAVVATKGDEVNLPAGTLIRVRLDRPLAIPRD